MKFVVGFVVGLILLCGIFAFCAGVIMAFMRIGEEIFRLMS